MKLQTIAPILLLIAAAGCRNTDVKVLDTSGLEETGDPVIDADADGYDASEDCDDANSVVHPGAEEICDGVDNNCDGTVDEGVTSTYYADTDGDGFGDPGALIESCEPPDGYAVIGTDCDDADAESYPGASEQCDDADNDCDGDIDEDVRYDWYADADGDGFGDPDSAFDTCDPPPGYVTDASDCDDTEETAFPGGEEVCDEVDNDCDGETDENVTTTYYQDTDGDGFGVADLTTAACDVPTGYAADPGDCDDSDGAVSPNAVEVCDEQDNDCDGDVDSDAIDQATFYTDADADGFGDPDSSTDACTAPSGTTDSAGDCDDTAAAVNPAATEVCDDIDNDCDGDIDTDATDMATFYADADGDGYGSSVSTAACDQPTGYADNSDDCDDGEPAANPGEPEVCDEIDNDCDGDTDEGVTATYYLDYDGDGYGNADWSEETCTASSGYVSDAADCDDLDSAVNPAATEVCDGQDNDCDGDTDDDDTSLDTTTAETFYADDDADGYGDPDSPITACEPPSGASEDDTDCDDGSADSYPGAEELCDGLDNDCDGDADSGVLGSEEECPAASCAEIFDDGSSTGDGTYWLDPAGSGTASEYECDMTTDGGGWTLVAEWDRINDGDTQADFESLMTENANNMYLWAEQSTYIEWADYDLDADVMAYEYAVEVPNDGEGILDLDFTGTSMECSGVWFFLRDTSGNDTDLTCRSDLSTAALCAASGHGSSYYSSTELSHEPAYTCATSANSTWTWSGDYQSAASAEIDTFHIVSMMFDAYGDQAYLYRFAFWVR